MTKIDEGRPGAATSDQKAAADIHNRDFCIKAAARAHTLDSIIEKVLGSTYSRLNLFSQLLTAAVLLQKQRLLFTAATFDEIRGRESRPRSRSAATVRDRGSKRKAADEV